MNKALIPVKFGLFLLAFLTSVAAQGNPLFSEPARDNQRVTDDKKVKPRSALPGMKALGPLLRHQKEIRASLSAHLRKLKTGFRFYPFLLIVAVAFAYGSLHALGPGHGKLVIGSYFLGKKALLSSSLRAGGIFAITHTGVSVLIFLAFYGVMKAANLQAQNSSTAFIYRISGIAICLYGTFLLYSAIRNRKHIGHMHSHDESDKGLALISALAGLAPCPATLLVLIFSHRLGIMFYGLVAVVAIGCGMALTAITVAALSISLSRAAITGWSEKPWFANAFGLARILGGLLIMLVGVGMAW